MVFIYIYILILWSIPSGFLVCRVVQACKISSSYILIMAGQCWWWMPLKTLVIPMKSTISMVKPMVKPPFVPMKWSCKTSLFHKIIRLLVKASYKFPFNPSESHKNPTFSLLQAPFFPRNPKACSMLAFVLPALLHFRRKDRGDATRGAEGWTGWTLKTPTAHPLVICYIAKNGLPNSWFTRG